jgi:hypothetical protein
MRTSDPEIERSIVGLVLKRERELRSRKRPRDPNQLGKMIVPKKAP